MKLRFTIRDLLWLAVVVALAAGWWLDHDRLVELAAIEPLAVLHVQAGSPKPGVPIAGAYLVEPDGRLNLGPGYGKVKVGGMSLREAESAVLR